MIKSKNAAYLLPLIVIFMSQCTVAFAQKLPKIQTSSVRAPESLKIDGKTTEWHDQFQAYNGGNFISYTLSNDDDNIYFTARLDDLSTRKLFSGGLTFTITSAPKKADRLSITFPVIMPMTETNKLWELTHGSLAYSTLKLDTIGNKAKIDSLISDSNKLISKVYDQIHVTGIPGTDRPLISIYNPQGIKVGASVDHRMRYTYELAIPLKYLETAINNVKSFRYNVQLNGTSTRVVESNVQSTKPQVTSIRFTGPGSLDNQFLHDATGFAGEYTLAKKQ